MFSVGWHAVEITTSANRDSQERCPAWCRERLPLPAWPTQPLTAASRSLSLHRAFRVLPKRQALCCPPVWHTEPGAHGAGQRADRVVSPGLESCVKQKLLSASPSARGRRQHAVEPAPGQTCAVPCTHTHLAAVTGDLAAPTTRTFPGTQSPCSQCLPSQLEPRRWRGRYVHESRPSPRWGHHLSQAGTWGRPA